MALTAEQRARLETLGPELVRQKYLIRGDVEDWLAEKQSKGAAVQRYTLRAAIMAGIASLAVATLRFTIWPRH